MPSNRPRNLLINKCCGREMSSFPFNHTIRSLQAWFGPAHQVPRDYREQRHLGPHSTRVRSRLPLSLFLRGSHDVACSPLVIFGGIADNIRRICRSMLQVLCSYDDSFSVTSLPQEPIKPISLSVIATCLQHDSP